MMRCCWVAALLLFAATWTTTVVAQGDGAQMLVYTPARLAPESLPVPTGAARPLILGVERAGNPPFEIVAEDGSVTGITADYVQAVARRLNREVRVSVEPGFERVTDRLRDGTIDFIGTAAATPGRVGLLRFGAPYFESAPVIVSRVDSGTDNAKFAGRVIVLERGFAVVEYIRREYPEGLLVEVGSTAEALARVSRGEADAYVGDLFVASYLIERDNLANLRIQSAAAFSTGGLRFAASDSEKGRALLAQIDTALDSLSALEREAIRQHWLAFGRLVAGAAPRLALTLREQEWLARNPVARVGADANYAPFSVVVDGQAGGLAGELLQLTALRAGLTTKLQSGLTWAEILKGLEERELDVVTAIARTPERDRYLNFVGPIANITSVLITRSNASYLANLGALRGKRLAVVRGYLADEYVKARYPEIERVQAGDLEEAFELVVHGRAEALLSNLEVGGPIMQQLYPGQLRVSATLPEIDTNLYFGVRKSAPELASVIDKSLASISVVERERLAQKWLRTELKSGLQWREIWRTLLPLALALAALIALIVMYAVSNSRLKRQINLRNQAEADLAHQLAFQTTLMDTIPSPIFFKDRRARYLGCNRAYETAFAVDRREIIGKTILETSLFTPEQRAIIHERDLHFLRTGGLSARDVRITYSDGSEHDIYSSINTFKLPSGETGGLLAVLVDVTAVHQNERELKIAKEAAEAATAAKSVFLATMSHEIRTPLHGMLGLLELLRHSQLNQTQAQQVRTATESGKSLLVLLNDLLDFSRIEAGGLDLERTRFSIVELVESVALAQAALCWQKKLELRVRVDPALPPTVWGDPVRIRQIIFNLTSNAIKFTDSGFVELMIRNDGGPAPFSAKQPVKIAVSDSGIGISPEHVNRLFRSFSQADSSTSRRYGGTGLGLAICKRLTDLMGGTLELDSLPGTGSRFALKLELEICDDTLAYTDGLVNRKATASIEGKRALILGATGEEDNYLSALLQHWRMYPAIPSLRPFSALHLQNLLIAQKPDIVLMDCEAVSKNMDITWEELLTHVIRWQTNGIAGQLLMLRREEDASFAARMVALPLTAPALPHVCSAPLIPSALRAACVQALENGNIATTDTPDAAAVHKPPDASAPPRPDQKTSIRLMVVDDHPVARMVAEGQLHMLGLAPEVFADAETALESFRQALDTANNRFALVITDLQMPGMDGLALIRAIRQAETAHPSALPVHILAVSAGTGSQDRTGVQSDAMVLAAGANALLGKPTVLHDLYLQLTTWFGAAIKAPATDEKTHGHRVSDVLDSNQLERNPVLWNAFASACQRDFNLLGEALLARDTAEIRRQAHRIKGAALLAGASNIASLAAKLESLPTQEALDFTATALRRMRIQLAPN